MGLKHPAVTARIENNDGAYILKSYNIIQERQKPTYVEFVIEEPIDPEQSALLSMGFENELKEKASLRIMKFYQVTPRHFECEAVDPASYILQADYNEYGTRLSFEEALSSLAGKFGLKLDIKTDEQIYKRHNLFFISTVRNALDQIMSIYKVEHWRYHIDTMKETLFILPGCLPKSAVELPLEYFLEENPERGLEFRILPGMSPFTPVIWRGKEQIVDSVEFDSESESMFLDLVDYEY